MNPRIARMEEEVRALQRGQSAEGGQAEGSYGEDGPSAPAADVGVGQNPAMSGGAPAAVGVPAPTYRGAVDLFPNMVGKMPARPTDTTRAAAEAIEPHSGTQRALVHDTIGDGHTDEEVSDITGLSENSVRPRRKELQERGLVRDSGRRRVTRRGHEAIVWEQVRDA